MKKSPVPLEQEFGQRVFVNGRWIKREEAEKLQGQKQDAQELQAIARLSDLEQQINQNFFAAAAALREIKQDKLYLHVADTWGQYCKERLGKGVTAVREQLKMLEISEDENRHNATKLPLISNDLSAESAKSPVEIIRPEGRKKEIERLRKLARIPEQKGGFSNAMEAAFRKAVPETELQSTPEEDLLDEIITRIRRFKHNLNFLKALKEWLDESAIT